VLEILSNEYELVEHRDAFPFLAALIGSGMHFETAGRLLADSRVWFLARFPECVELGGDLSAKYIYVASSHDGSMAVTVAYVLVIRDNFQSVLPLVTQCQPADALENRNGDLAVTKRE
jgi:hypothetical protein